MAFHTLLQSLNPEIEDSEEETFLLFAKTLLSQNLGFVDNKATTLNLTIAGRDFTVTQSPALLSSNRKQGTTGAVVWKITPLFAEWIASKSNVFFQSGILDTQSTVLELGCGISGIIPMILAPKVGRYIATDQEYLFKVLKQNLQDNAPISQKRMSGKRGKRKSKNTITAADSNIDVIALDWETSFVFSLPLLLSDGSSSVDILIACDCIYNDALVQPFVNTCAEICRLRRSSQNPDNKPTLCVVGQQLRSDIVFEAWLAAFLKVFRVWRVHDELAGDGMAEGSGFVLHIAILKDESF
ncbi:MAG: hypothetical protein Q9164_000141 [Protoblastenia rupestris]